MRGLLAVILALLSWPALAQPIGCPFNDSLCVSKSSGSTTARSQAARWADVINVKDYGAKGDGATDDTATIQAALATGKSVWLPISSGAYVISSALSVSSGTRVILDGIVKLNANITGFQIAAAANDIVFSGSGSIDGNSGTWASSGPAISAPNGVTNLTVEGLYIHHSGTSGVNVSGSANSSGVRILRNRTMNNGTSGIFFNTASGFFVSNFDISHNTTSNNGTSGVTIGLATDGIVGWNYAEFNTPGHLLADNFTGYDHRNARLKIIGNISVSGGNHGIHFGGDNVSYIGNHSINSHQHGIMHRNDDLSTSKNIIMADNVVDGTDLQSGLDVENATNVSVTGNVVRGATQRGIYIFNVSHGTVAGNSVSSNTLDGIRLSNGTDITVSANDSTSNGGSGIFVGDSNGPITASGVTSNYLTANTAYGIFEGNVSDASLYVSGNNVTGNTAGAINVQSYADYSRL